MRILAVDTTSESLRLAITDGKRTWARSWRRPQRQDEALWSALHGLMASARMKWKDVEAIATASGPGSFTGVRVGMTFASVLAASLDIPVIGVSLLEAAAHRAPGEGLLIVILPALRDELFVQAFKGTAHGHEPLEGPVWLRAADWREAFRRLARGKDALLTGPAAGAALRLLPRGARAALMRSRPLTAADLIPPAFERLKRGPAGELAPLYLKPAYYERAA